MIGKRLKRDLKVRDKHKDIQVMANTKKNINRKTIPISEMMRVLETNQILAKAAVQKILTKLITH